MSFFSFNKSSAPFRVVKSMLRLMYPQLAAARELAIAPLSTYS
jgi:hypothetical protein